MADEGFMALVNFLVAYKGVWEPEAVLAGKDTGTRVVKLTLVDLSRVQHEMADMSDRLIRITSWHARESGPHGMVGDYCTECGNVWPCDTRKMADGTIAADAEV